MRHQRITQNPAKALAYAAARKSLETVKSTAITFGWMAIMYCPVSWLAFWAQDMTVYAS